MRCSSGASPASSSTGAGRRSERWARTATLAGAPRRDRAGDHRGWRGHGVRRAARADVPRLRARDLRRRASGDRLHGARRHRLTRAAPAPPLGPGRERARGGVPRRRGRRRRRRSGRLPRRPPPRHRRKTRPATGFSACGSGYRESAVIKPLPLDVPAWRPGPATTPRILDTSGRSRGLRSPGTSSGAGPLAPTPATARHAPRATRHDRRNAIHAGVHGRIVAPAELEVGDVSSGAETRWGTGVNAEAIEAWDGPLFDRFVHFRHVLTTGLGAARRGGPATLVPPSRRARARHRLRLRRHDAARSPRMSARGRGRRRRRAAALHRVPPARRPARPASRTSRFARRRRADGRARRALRPGLLAHGDDVLRQPGRGDAQRPRGAAARRPAGDGRLAPADRQRLALPRADDRRAASSSAPRSTTSRPAAPARSRWPTPTRRQRHPAARRLRRRRPAPLRPADPDRPRPRRGDRPRHGARTGGRDPAARGRPRGCTCTATSTPRCATAWPSSSGPTATSRAGASTWIVTATAPA